MCGFSCKTTFSNKLWISRCPLQSIKPTFSTLVHKKAYAGACCSDHLPERLLADLRDNRLASTILPKFANKRRARAKRFSLELNN
jgi:hypothetical protein